MKKLLLAIALVVLATPAFAQHHEFGHPNHQCMAIDPETGKEKENGDMALCPGETEAFWVKSVDVSCTQEGQICEIVDNYTDNHKKGMHCGNFGIPVYGSPNGQVFGTLDNEPLASFQDVIWTKFKRVGKYTEIYVTTQKDGPPHNVVGIPADVKSLDRYLKSCG